MSEQQLAAKAPGAVGNVLETLHHIVQAEQGYLTRLASERLPSNWERALPKDFATVRERAAELATLWAAYASANPDANELRRARWWDVTHEYPAGMEIAQALSHSYGHREQICTILTTIDVPAPELEGLAWGDAMGLLRRLPAGT